MDYLKLNTELKKNSEYFKNQFSIVYKYIFL